MLHLDSADSYSSKRNVKEKSVQQMGHKGDNQRINYPAPRCALLITLG